MHEFERRGVQRETVQSEALAKKPIVGALAVTNVTNDGVADVFQMSADLVKSPGLGGHVEEGVALEGVTASKVGHSVDSLLIAAIGHGVVDGPLFAGYPTNQRPVAFFHFLGSKGATEGPRNLGA